MVGDKRKPERVDVEKSEDREKGPAEKQRRRQAAAHLMPAPKEEGENRQQPESVKIANRIARFDPPPRVDEGEVCRPGELREIECDHVARQQQSLGETPREFGPVRADQ